MTHTRGEAAEGLGAGDHGVEIGCAARKSQKPALELGGWAGGAWVPCSACRSHRSIRAATAAQTTVILCGVDGSGNDADGGDHSERDDGNGNGEESMVRSSGDDGRNFGEVTGSPVPLYLL